MRHNTQIKQAKEDGTGPHKTITPEIGKKKVLVLASVASMIGQFNMANIRLLLTLGYEVHTACNFQKGNTCGDKQIRRLQKTLQDMHVVQHQWDCPRKVSSAVQCCRAYRQLWEITGRYDFAWIHCQSPIGGVLARAAAHRRGIRVIYTAHGFHFYKGAPLHYWMLYYPVEKLLAHWTQVLVTVNREDYLFAKRHLKAEKICHIPGVGIDTQKYGMEGEARMQDKEALCKKFGFPKDAQILLSVGELNKGKNHRLVIEALARMKRQDVYYLVCGQGKLRRQLLRYADRLGVDGRVRMPGFWDDMPWIYQNTDLFVFPSVREGMPAALMEAMAAGMPCVVSDIRGNRELVDGMRFSCKKPEQLRRILETMLGSRVQLEQCGRHNKRKIQGYGQAVVEKRMRRIYQEMDAEQTRRQLKILHVLKTDAYAGAENVVITICKALECPPYRAAYAAVDGRIAEYVHRAGIPFFPMRRFSIKELRRVLRAYKPDIVHAHDFSASVLCALLKTDYELVSHLHNNPPWIQKWNAKSAAYRLAEKRIGQILVVSKAVQEEAVFLQDVRGKLSQVNNPVDQAGIRAKAEEFLPDHIDLLFVGRLTQQKNPQRFIRLVSGLRQYKSGLSAVMAGTGELEAECRRMVRRLGLEHCIKIIGFQENPYPYIKQAQLLLVTSDWEGYGMAAAEAAVLGTPVLALEVGGLKTIFRECPQALCRSEAQMRQKAGRLLQDQAYYEHFKQEISRKAFVEETGTYMKRIKKIYGKGVS